MNLYELTFSPTGGTQRVSDGLFAGLGAIEKKIDLTDPRADFSSVRFGEEDVCVVSVPSFAGRVPAPAVSRLQKISGGGALAVAVVAYGNRAYDDTLIELSDVLTASGFRVFAGVTAVAEHSVLRQYAAGRPDADDCRQLAAFGSKIREAAALGQSASPAFPGNRPYRAAGSGVKPTVGADCRLCGVCADLCPVGAISTENPREFDREVCFSCLRCISVCPTGARSLLPETLDALNQRIGPHLSGRRENELFL